MNKPYNIEANAGDGLVAALQNAQEHYGFLPEDVIEKISEVTDVPLSQIYGVITFYSHFSLKPVGKHYIKVCRGTACHVRGADSVIEAFKDQLNIGVGDTTEDRMFTLETVACLGACALAPLVLVNKQYYGKVDYEKINEILSLGAKEE